MSYGLFESKVDLYNRTFWEVYGKDHPRGVKTGESRAGILSPARGFLGTFDYTMQLKVGCPGGCLFCYVQNSPRLGPADLRARWGFEVRSKKDSLGKLKRALLKGVLADRTIYWSAVTDPYAVKGSFTRDFWRIMLDTPLRLRPRRIVVQSRFRVGRDRSLIAQYLDSTRPSDDLPAVVVSLTVGTDRDDLIHSWERATPDYGQRMKTVAALRNSGIKVIPTLSPFSLWNDLELTLRRFREMDIRMISVIFLKEKTSTARTPGPFIEYIRRRFPLILDPAWQEEQLKLMASVVGKENILVGQQGFSRLASPYGI